MKDKILGTLEDALHDLQTGFADIVRPVDFLLIFGALNIWLAVLTVSIAERIINPSEHPIAIFYVLTCAMIGAGTGICLAAIWLLKNLRDWLED